jgi:ketosteroid isomerase-like protein
MSTEQTRQLIEDYYAALTKGDKARLLELLAPDCVFQPPASAPSTVVKGAEAIADALGRTLVRTTFDVSQPVTLDVHRKIVDGDFAVVQQRVRATAKATGKPYDNEYCWVYHCKDGRIARMEEYADTLVAGRAFGWDLSS